MLQFFWATRWSISTNGYQNISMDRAAPIVEHEDIGMMEIYELP